MRTKWALVLGLALGIAATPALAGHKHRRGCGHVYSRAHHGWVSVNVVTPRLGFSYSRAPRYDDYYDPYYDGRHRSRRHRGGYWDPYRWDSRYDRHRGYWKKHRGHHHHYRDRCHW